MKSEPLAAMQQHIKAMNTLLAKIKQETDQDKRDAMLAAFAESIEEMMPKQGVLAHFILSVP